MKHFLTHIGAALTAVGISLLSVSCGGGDKDGEGSSNGKGDEESSASLEEQMMGYWAVDPEEMKAMAEAEAEDNPLAKQMIEAMLPMMGSMVMEFTKGKGTIYMMGQAQEATYEITKEDAATKTITMNVTDDEGTEEGSAVVGGDTLKLSRGEETIILTRLTKEEFDKRKSEAPNLEEALGNALGEALKGAFEEGLETEGGTEDNTEATPPGN